MKLTKVMFIYLYCLVYSCGALAVHAEEFFEQTPIQYSETKPNNKVALLDGLTVQWVSERRGELALLEMVLGELGISRDSQLLVFSRTSAQKKRIFPNYPRAIYFSDSCYVGYIPGGTIEIIASDPALGLVFYVLDLKKDDQGESRYRLTRDSACLSCHVSSQTRGVPGLLARSVSTDELGEIDFLADHLYVDDETPINKRWGGWYVTGNWSGMLHRGNAFDGKSVLPQLADVKKIVDTSRYPASESDITALMVFEHQCKIHTLLVEAKLYYLRAQHLESVIKLVSRLPKTESSSYKTAMRVAENIVEAMFFCDEAYIGGAGIEGNEAFEKAFEKKAILSKDGKHLRALRMYGRMFKYRCSYMIYSESFTSLPELIKKLVFQRMYDVLNDREVDKKYIHLKTREKASILRILQETTPISRYLKK